MKHVGVGMLLLGVVALGAYVAVEAGRPRGFSDPLTLTLWGVGLFLTSALMSLGRDRP